MLEDVAVSLEKNGGFDSTVIDIRDAISQIDAIVMLMGVTDNPKKDVIRETAQKIKNVVPYIKLLLELNKPENAQDIQELLNHLKEWINMWLLP